VTDTSGCTAMDTVNVVVNDKPHVDSIIVIPSSGNSFTFVGASPKYVQSQSWDFGDGLMSPADSPGHTYLNWGEYTVRLVISNNCGSDTVYKTLTAIPAGITVSQKSASFSIFPNPATSYLKVANHANHEIRNV